MDKLSFIDNEGVIGTVQIGRYDITEIMEIDGSSRDNGGSGERTDRIQEG